MRHEAHSASVRVEIKPIARHGFCVSGLLRTCELHVSRHQHIGSGDAVLQACFRFVEEPPSLRSGLVTWFASTVLQFNAPVAIN